MADQTPRPVSVEDDPYLAVRAAAAEARRLSDAFRSLNGNRCPNPVTLAVERLQAGLIQYIPEDRRIDAQDEGGLRVILPPAPAGLCSPNLTRESSPGQQDSGLPDLDTEEIEEEVVSLRVDGLRGGDLVLQEPGQDESGQEIGDEISGELGEGHPAGDGHEDESAGLIWDGGDHPDTEPEPKPSPPASTPDGRPDTPIHIGE
jgi:hypothetical protein